MFTCNWLSDLIRNDWATRAAEDESARQMNRTNFVSVFDTKRAIDGRFRETMDVERLARANIQPSVSTWSSDRPLDRVKVDEPVPY